MAVLVSAAVARQASEHNRASIISTRKRNAAAKARKEREARARAEQEWFETTTKEFDAGIAKAIKRGYKLFKQEIATLIDKPLSPTAMLKADEDGAAYRKIFARLRRQGYKVTIKVKSVYNSGVSCYEGVSDTDPWTSYHYWAVVTW